ncbi:lactadherin-like isoform X1 [Ptychodera flava]|uniref:lactadherin-like isoform X1 n=1 Tax=Ptychodera flava TaxID=63121 RepID=UPI00396A505E
MDIRGLTLCSDDDDCLNGGNCTLEDDGAYNQVCKCAVPFGGDRCELDCSANAVGVADRDIIKDTQFTSYGTYSSNHPWYGRLNYGSYYWRGSWLQVSFNKLYEVYAVETQGYSSSYGVTAFRLLSSIDGNTFTYYTESSSSYKTFSMSQGSKITRNELKVRTRMSAIRFYVTGYSSYPYLRVEVYGCPVIDVE